MFSVQAFEQNMFIFDVLEKRFIFKNEKLSLDYFIFRNLLISQGFFLKLFALIRNLSFLLPLNMKC